MTSFDPCCSTLGGRVVSREIVTDATIPAGFSPSATGILVLLDGSLFDDHFGDCFAPDPAAASSRTTVPDSRTAGGFGR